MGYSPWGDKELDMTEQLKFLLFKKKEEREGREHTSLMELTGFYVLYFVTENHGMQGRQMGKI